MYSQNQKSPIPKNKSVSYKGESVEGINKSNPKKK